MDKYPKEKRSQIMSRIGSKDTYPELKVRSSLHKLGYRFRVHRADLPGKPDIVLPKYKTVIFIHGCFWHGHVCSKGKHLPKTNKVFWEEKLARNRERDLETIKKLKMLGWRVLVMWECEIKCSENIEKIILNNLPEKSNTDL